MTTTTEPTQTSRRLENDGVWIEGQLIRPPEGLTGPLVIGRDWLLEMVQTENGHIRVFFWAPFAIVCDFPQVDSILNGRFVGFSVPSRPPRDWLVTSMMFDLERVSLARTPQEFIALISEPRPYLPLENTAASPLSQKAKGLIATTFTTSILMREVARALGVSHAHLTRQFKADFGLSPLDYQHRLRVTEAVSRLSRGEGILDIGYDVGFDDTGRFYKNFRKITGTSPGRCKR
jgi:AraC-like DNA-binding protein